MELICLSLVGLSTTSERVASVFGDVYGLVEAVDPLLDVGDEVV